MKLKYRSPMTDKYLEVGKIECKGYDLATMIDTDDFGGSDICTYKHGSDGGGLQTEVDEIGEKIVRAYNSHDELLAACERWVAYTENTSLPPTEATAAMRAMRLAITHAKGESS